MGIPSFLFGGDAVPVTKSDLNPPPGGYDPTKYWAAADYNAVRTAMLDVATTLGTQVISSINGQPSQTLTPNLANGCTFIVKLDANGTIANPTGTVDIGTTLRFLLTQDSTGGRTLAWGTHYSGASALPLRPGAGALTAAEFVLSSDGVTWQMVPEYNKYFDVRDYGATGVGTVDDKAAIQSAVTAAKNAGGGIVFFHNSGAGKFYGISDTITHGVQYVNMSDVTLTALGYPTPPSGYSAQVAASYNGTNAALNLAIPHVSFEGAPGAALGWIGSDPASEKPMIYYAAQPNGSVGASAPFMQGYIRGLSFYGFDQVSGGSYIAVAGSTPVTGHVSGIFAPGTSRLTIQDCNLYGVKRGVVTSDNYWGLVQHNYVFRCVDGFTYFSNNAADAFNNIAGFATGNGHIITGQGWRAFGVHTENAPCALNVPQADDFHICGGYMESPQADTDTYIKLGENNSGINVSWGVVENLTMSIAGSVASKHMAIKSGFGITFINCRFRYNNLTNNPSSVDSASQLIRFIGCNIPLDSTTTGTPSIMQNISFDQSYYDGGGRLLTLPGSSTRFMLPALYSADSGPMQLFSDVVDGSSAVAHILDTDNALVNAAAKHFSGRVHGVEKYFFDIAGGLSLDGVLSTTARALNRRNVLTSTLLDTSQEMVSANTNGVGNVVITLPPTANINGRRYIIHRAGSNDGFTVTIQPSSGDLILQQGNSTGTITLPFGNFVELVTDGGAPHGNWYMPSELEITAVGSSPNGNGATVRGQQITLQPADGSNPGIVSSGTQEFNGPKTLTNHTTLRGGMTAHSDGSDLTFADDVNMNADLITSGRTERRVNVFASRSVDLHVDERLLANTGLGADITMTLPASAPVGKRYIIGRGGNPANVVSIAPATGESIGRLAANGLLTLGIDSYVTLSSNGAGLWDIVDCHPGQLTLTTGTYTLTATTNVVLLNPSGGNITATLPVASDTIEGLVYVFKRYADGTGNTVTINAGAGGTFDGGGSSETLASGKYLQLVCDGTTWWVVAQN